MNSALNCEAFSFEEVSSDLRIVPAIIPLSKYSKNK